MSKIKLLILLTVFIDIIGVGIVIPILPFYVESYSHSPLLITSLVAVFSLCSFISAPIIGAWSDRVGRKPMLIMSIFSTALGWFIFAEAKSIPLLFLGRIVDGLAAGNFPIAQSYLSDIAKTDKERTANLGIIGAVFGIGFIIGPFLGGMLSQLGHTVPFYFVGTLALLNAILGIFMLPETHLNRTNHPISLNPLRPIFKAFIDRKLRTNYAAWFMFGVAIASYQAVFALYLKDVFGFNEVSGGLMFAASGLMLALNQGIAMKHVWLRWFREPTLELYTLLCAGFGLIFMQVPQFLVFSIGFIVATFAHSILRVVMTSQVVGMSDQTRRGEVLGILSSVMSVSMTIAPIAAGSLYQYHHRVPFLFSALCMIVAFVLLFLRKRRVSRLSLPENVPSIPEM